MFRELKEPPLKKTQSMMTMPHLKKKIINEERNYF